MDKRTNQYSIKGELSQNGRLIPALMPQTVPIDDRTAEDFLQFLLRFSEQIVYYDNDDQPMGDWLDFFVSDKHLLYGVLANISLTEHLAVYESLTAKIHYTIDEKGQSESLKGIFDVQLRLAKYIQMINVGLAYQSQSDYFYQQFYKSLEQEDFSGQIQKLAGLMQAYSVMYPGKNIADPQGIVSQILGDKQIPVVQISGIDSYETALNFSDELSGIFEKLRNIVGYISSNAAYQVGLLQGYADRKPQVTLLAAFLDLYKYLQESINEIPFRHLSFYYKEFLKIKKNPACPDTTFLYIAGARNAPPSFALESKTGFSGDLPTGETVLFELQRDAVITKGEVIDLKTISILHGILGNKKLPSATIYSGMPLVAAERDMLDSEKVISPWPLLGNVPEPGNDFQLTPADIGCLISSPVLLQKYSTRRFIFFIFPDQKWIEEVLNKVLPVVSNIENKNEWNKRLIEKQRIFSDIFILSVTTENGWYPVKRKSISFKEQESGFCIMIDFVLQKNEPDISPYKEAIHKLQIHESNPAIRLLLNPQAYINGYLLLKDFLIKRVDIKAEIRGSNDFELDSNIGPIDKSKPFLAFGSVPMSGSYLEIKSNTIFNRFTVSSCLEIEWADLPKNNLGFRGYYAEYPQKLANHSFKATCTNAYRDSRDIPGVCKTIFSTIGDDESIGPLNTLSRIQLNHSSEIRFFNPAKQFTTSEQSLQNYMLSGTLRVELTEPEEGFGQKIYSKIFADAVLHNTRHKKRKVPVPNEPYIPKVKKLMLDYDLFQSQQTLSKVDDRSSDDDIKIHQLLPYGSCTVFPVATHLAPSLVHDFENEANLFIGLSELQPGGLISLFFEIEENKTEANTYISDDYQWNYLSNNSWISIEKDNILSNDTASFLQSGSVVFQIPSNLDMEACLNNTILPGSVFWIRIAIPRQRGYIPFVKRVIKNVFAVTRVMNADTSVQPFIPSGVINTPLQKNVQIGNIVQFASSTGGKAAETDTAYFRRVSELLRHKNRAVTARDISSILLEKFHELFYVKCIVNRNAGFGKHRRAADIEVVLVPALLQERHKVMVLPRVSVLVINQVKEYLRSFLPNELTADVFNPEYEKIRVVCTISIKPSAALSATEGFYRNKLNKELQHFISPWFFHQQEATGVVNVLYTTDIHNFIKDRPYVEKIESFSVLHLYSRDIVLEDNQADMESYKYTEMLDSAVSGIEVLKAVHLRGILISSRHHLIDIVPVEAKKKTVASGIGTLMIGEDLHLHHGRLPEEDKNKKKSSAGLSQLYNFEIS
jgi:hypothetical protein